MDTSIFHYYFITRSLTHFERINIRISFVCRIQFI